MNTLKHFKHLSLPAAMSLIMTLLLFSSCDSFVYDEEGDCSVTYDLKFRYDMNLKWADAFSNEVKSVNLYAFDENGVLVWKNSEAGSRLASPDYSMDLPLRAGNTLSSHGADWRTARNASRSKSLKPLSAPHAWRTSPAALTPTRRRTA